MGDSCTFEHNAWRCPFPATIDGRWCLWHGKPEHRGHGPEQDDFYRTYCATREHVRDTLELWYGAQDWRDEMVDALIAERPGWQRGADEPRSVYVGRMRALRGELEGLVGTGRRPPPPDRAALIEDALEEYEERAGRLEAEGVPRELAQSQALEDVLRTRLGTGPA